MTEGLLAEVFAKAERFDAGDPSVLRQIKCEQFGRCRCRKVWTYLIKARLAASQLPLARKPRISAGRGIVRGLAVFVEMEIIGAAGGAIMILLSSPGKRRCGYAVA